MPWAWDGRRTRQWHTYLYPRCVNSLFPVVEFTPLHLQKSSFSVSGDISEMIASSKLCRYRVLDIVKTPRRLAVDETQVSIDTPDPSAASSSTLSSTSSQPRMGDLGKGKTSSLSTIDEFSQNKLPRTNNWISDDSDPFLVPQAGTSTIESLSDQNFNTPEIIVSITNMCPCPNHANKSSPSPPL